VVIESRSKRTWHNTTLEELQKTDIIGNYGTQEWLPTILPYGAVSSPNVLVGTGGTKYQRQSAYLK